MDYVFVELFLISQIGNGKMSSVVIQNFSIGNYKILSIRFFVIKSD
jgi:hypothetical protein